MRTAALLLLALLPSPPTAAAGGPAPKPDPLPEGTGLSAKYPRDRGIGKDPAVLLAEDFEEGALTDLGKRWDQVDNRGGRPLALPGDGPAASRGKRSLEVTATLGKDHGGSLYRLLPRGVDRAFARFYVKFPRDAGYVHHFVWLGGHEPGTRWPHPRAGERPAGNERFSAGIEPWGNGGRSAPPGLWNFYVYWCEMKVSADGRHWGNGLAPVKPQEVPRDRWQCVEFMVKLNTKPDARDGELALWLDGKPVARFRRGAPRGPWTGLGFRLLEEGGEPFEGFRWRTSDDLKVNYFWLNHYVTPEALRRQGVREPPPENRVRFDDVVVATEYVGPVAE